MAGQIRAAYVSGLLAALFFSLGSGTALAHPRVSGNIRLIPPSPRVTVAPLPKRAVHAGARRALRAAEQAWGLRSGQIEVIVRAVVTENGLAVAGWAVVARMLTHSPAPGYRLVYSEMVIVVSGATGQVVFSYPAAPVSQSAQP